MIMFDNIMFNFHSFFCLKIEVNWEEHVDDEGYTYFFNRKSGESQWERPLQTVLSRVYAMKAFGTTVNFTSTGATPPVSPR